MSEKVTAAEVAKVAEFYAGEGDAYSTLAEDLKRDVLRLEAEEVAAEYLLWLAKHICAVSYDYDGAYDNAPEYTRERFDLYAKAAMEKLAADGRLKEPAPIPREWEKWEDVPQGVPYKPKYNPHHRAVVNRGAGRFYADDGSQFYYTGYMTFNYDHAPFVEVEP